MSGSDWDSARLAGLDVTGPGGRSRPSLADPVWPAWACSSDLRPCSRLPELDDDRIKTLARDVLHHVEVNALVFADAVDWHDVGVVQPGGGLGLALETQNIFRRDQSASRARP